MDIKKCDMCKNEIGEKGDYVYVRFPLFESADLCSVCALPILKFLKRNKIMDKDAKKINKS